LRFAAGMGMGRESQLTRSAVSGHIKIFALFS
jgi:hypothetical protein